MLSVAPGRVEGMLAELKESSWGPVLRTRLRIVGTSDLPVVEPLLVCAACQEWLRHRRPTGALPSVDSERQSPSVDDLWECSRCRARRTWGRRVMAHEDRRLGPSGPMAGPWQQR
jgi:hypothetical protein